MIATRQPLTRAKQVPVSQHCYFPMTDHFQAKPTAEGLKRYPSDGTYRAPDGLTDGRFKYEVHHG
jgi:hypothetical protein